MITLNYNNLTQPQKKVITAFYALLHGGRVSQHQTNGHTYISLHANGWLEFDGTNRRQLTIEGERAVEAHRRAKKTSASGREKMEEIARMAQLAKERMEKAS